MRALVFTAPGAAEVVDVPEPTVGATDVLVRMIRVGLCHSDITLLEGDYIFPVQYPAVPGHEWFGEIVEIGAKVTGFRVGDRVVGECAVSPTLRFGFNMNGALAEYFTADAGWIHKAPAGCSDAMGALVEPFTIAYNATSNIDASDTVVVLGAGPIGLCAMASAAAKGGRVIAVEPADNRRQLAKHLGAEHTIDPTTSDAISEIEELTHGRGAEVVVEASGNGAAMASAFRMAAFNGRLVNVGINVHAEATAPLGRIVERALTVRGMEGSAGVWPAAIRFLERTRLDLTPLVSAEFPLANSVAGLLATERRTENIKVHITGSVS